MTVAVLFCVIRREVVTAMVYWVQGLALIIAQKIQSRVLLFQIPLASLLTATAPAVAIGTDRGTALLIACITCAAPQVSDVRVAFRGVFLERLLVVSQWLRVLLLLVKLNILCFSQVSVERYLMSRLHLGGIFSRVLTI